MTTQRRQFTLRSLFLLILAVAVTLGVLRTVEEEWLIALTVIAPVIAACLAISCVDFGRLPPPGWRMLTAICIPSLWLLWLGLHPRMYYMEGAFLVMVLWYGFATTHVIRFAYYRPFGQHRVPPHRTRWLHNQIFVLIPLAVTLLVAFRIPLYIGFLTARPGLTALVESEAQSAERSLAVDQRCGIYTISAAQRRTG